MSVCCQWHIGHLADNGKQLFTICCLDHDVRLFHFNRQNKLRFSKIKRKKVYTFWAEGKHFNES